MSEPTAPKTPSWMSELSEGRFSLVDAVGGVRGLIESLLPGVVFLITYIISANLMITLIVSGGISVLFCIVRLIQRTPITQAFTGLLGVGIGILWAATSGQPKNYYTMGLLTNAVYGGAILVTLLIRRPVAAIAARLMWGLPKDWRKQETYQILYRRCVIVTWIWLSLFVLRLVVQLPLFLADAVVPLGTARLIMGTPLFAFTIWLTWVLLREVTPRRLEKAKEQLD